MKKLIIISLLSILMLNLSLAHGIEGEHEHAEDIEKQELELYQQYYSKVNSYAERDSYTRYNRLRDGCYYYYSYGSCKVDDVYCNGVPAGTNKDIDLGDACGRNLPPILTDLENIQVKESDLVEIKAKCIDQDPVEMVITGWTDKKRTQTDYNSQGVHTVEITCVDSFEKIAKGELTVTVENVNRGPLFRAINHIIK
jgi:hypothetical protein